MRRDANRRAYGSRSCVASHCHLRRWDMVGQLLKARRASADAMMAEWLALRRRPVSAGPDAYLFFLLFSQQTDQHFTLFFVRVSCEQATEARDVFAANESLDFHTTFLFRVIHWNCPFWLEARSG